ncbi:Phosphate-import protein PhnD precursor [Afipia felis]|uniref:Phosphate-import protein PhnD n=1 Tax=Afipia felis TaxID=1035 RepID=A0A090MVK4_AFIFE|nr:phosphate/phosphite/phosphonate ABC transporter substrate-binding protein [Afipia felis]CEG10572.1 Phosphate-import protein PhnD precursor [Afipia felis]
MHVKHVLSASALVLTLALIGNISATPAARAETVKEPDTLTIAWLPNDSSDGLAGMRDEIANVIAKATGKKVENKLTTDYAIAIAALENGQAQIGWFGANEYLTSHARDPKVIPLVVNTGPSGTLKDALYYSRFVVKKGEESKYQKDGQLNIENIVGKRMSFVSTNSTSGFNMPAAAIVGEFKSDPKWNKLTFEDLQQGGDGHFFRQVMFGGSHQLSLVNALTGRADVAAVCDFLVTNYVKLISGADNTAGAVYEIKQDAAAPFTALGGKQFVIIKSIPVLNPPVEVNSAYLSDKTLKEITDVLSSDEVANNPKIFAPADAKGSDFKAPARFVKVADSWYDPMRKVLGIK